MDLINTFDLTPTAIGNIIDELIKADIIHKVGYGKSKGGRPPVLYAIKWDKVYVIAIAIGVQNISASLVNLKGEIRGEIIFDNSNSPLIERVYRSEEHTSELQSRFDLVCRLLLEQKNNQ